MIKYSKKKGLFIIESTEDESMDMVRDKLEKDMDEKYLQKRNWVVKGTKILKKKIWINKIFKIKEQN